MKHILSVLILLVASSAFAQTLYTHKEIISISQDSVTVKAGLHRGNIQWQKSLDNKNWLNIEGKTNDSLKVTSDTEASYRAQITDGTCLPVYSDTAKIIIDTKVLTVYDMRQDSLWDYWVTSNNGSNFLAKVNNQKPVSVYYKPDKNSDGYFIFFDERGLPSKLVISDNIFLFENYRDSLMDVSWVLPSGEIQIFRDVKSDIDLSTYNLKNLSYTLNNDWLIFGLKTASQAISVASCVSGLLATSTGVGAPIGIPLLIGCGATVVGLVAELLPEEYNGKFLGLTASTVGGLAGVAACLNPNDPYQLFTCAKTTVNSIIKLSKEVVVYLDNENVTTAQNLLQIPTISTSAVTNITQTTAICGGNITSEGSSTVTDRGVCWNTTGSPTPADNHTFNLSVTGSFTANLTGLTANTTYYMRAYATNSAGTAYGDQVTFTTSQAITQPNVTTNAITDITQTTATNGGNVTSDGGSPVTAKGVCWNTTGNPTTASSKTTNGSGTGSFTSSLTGLTTNTFYYVRAYAANSNGTAYGDQLTFTTGQAITPPILTTNPITAITQTTATSGGNITSDGGAAITASGVCWSTSQDPTTATNFTTDGNGSSFTSNLTGLTASTTYYVRAYATNSQGTAYGNEINFTTKAAVETGTVTDIDGNVYHTVTIGTQVWMVENLKTTKYSDGTSIPNVTDDTTWDALTIGAYSWYNNDISYKIPYGAFYNWYTVNTGKLAPTGWHVPSDAEWTTLENYLITNGYNYDGTTTGNRDTNNRIAKALASATGWNSFSDTGTVGNTDYPAKRNATGFTALPGGYRGYNGTYVGIGGSGYWWSSTESSTSGAWSRGMNLNYSDVYRYNAFKQYGFSVRCVRDDNVASVVVPTLTTLAVSSITQTTAITGGNVTSDGGAIITASGVCWSTSQDPTTATNFTTDGNSISFTSNLSGLTANTTYYVRAYATNSAGTAYGDQLSFTTTTAIETGTVTDIDGNVYHTVTIGTQVWMVENLKTTRYNDGTSIPNVTDNTEWANLTTPGYCWYDNDISYKNPYGALYNWYSVNTGKLAPTGWHVPTDAEWTSLTTFLGGESVAGGKLKEAGTTHWASPNTAATNESGFTALSGGYREYDGSYYYIGNLGGWWSSTESGAYDAWLRFMGSDHSGVIRVDRYKQCGFSVRCVSDDNVASVVVPTLSTSSVSSITQTTATSGGNITSDGGATVTARGVCWSTSENPTIANSKTTDGSGIGSFTSSITGLIATTTYYVRAYASNSAGTAYGNQVNFTTAATIETGTVTDIDGNVYQTVTIGTQVWMAENLKTTHYNDGTSIPNATSEWGFPTPAFCWYDNDVSYKNSYGALYNWYTVNTGKLAPTGWHVPTDAEWTTLSTYLGGENVAGGKMKEAGTAHWLSPNTGATNSSGFTALPVGYRHWLGYFSSLAGTAAFWSSSQYDVAYAWNLYIFSSSAITGLIHDNKSIGMSARCVKD